MREDIQSAISERYGNIPKKPRHLRCELICEDRSFAAGRAKISELRLICECDEGEVSFKAKSIMPNDGDNLPFFIYLAERGDVPDRFLPAEELCDLGVGVLLLDYRDIASDDEEYRCGIASKLVGSRRGLRSPSKTALWAFAVMRAIEYVRHLSRADSERICVIAHSHLCAAALVGSAMSEVDCYTALNNPSEPTSSHRFAKRHILGALSDFINSAASAGAKKLFVSLSEEDKIEDYRGITLRKRDGGSYLGRGDWNYFVKVLKG